MSALLLKANDFNQAFNNCFYSTVPITWHGTGAKVKWSHEASTTKLLPYYFFNILLIIVVGSIIMSILLPLMYFFPELFQTKQMFAVVFNIGAFIPAACLAEWILFRFGAVIAAGSNWAVESKRKYRIPPHFSIRAGVPNAIFAEIWKVILGSGQVDKYGICAIFLFLVVSPLSILIPIVFIYAKLDPCNILLIGLSSPKTLNLSPIQNSFFTQIVFYITGLSAMLSMFIGIKTPLICALPIMQFQLEQCHHLKTQPLTQERIRRYRQSKLVNQWVYLMLQKMMRGYLTMAFYLLLLCLNVILLGWRILPWNEFLPIPGIALLVAGVLLIMLDFGCEAFEVSEDVLRWWKRQILLMPRKSKEVRRVVRSLQPLIVPVADAGIMDRDIKRNYLGKLLDSFVNSLIVAHGIF